ncbi:hypothetical protein PSACC_00985 [Paramicrosporidium saccamoebae]|uniref:RRM domain-containing protein n=1 Tax=Paramicrosporidium saccamoebae TaxID=1246581 RepID=A0A2H9TN75_9FUNG|nr:hypothetical protein PSACC_00985 [Paramicrosporidium saccamoebae]
MVTNIASQTTEEALRDFFAFCGDISMLHLYTTAAGSKEAVVKFDTPAAASTACLLNNALIDGNNIKVEPLPVTETPQPSNSPQSDAPTNASYSSMFTAWATAVANKVKSVDEQYQVSNTVTAGASSAWESSKKLAQDFDEKYHVKEAVASAVVTTKEGLSTAATKINEKVSGVSPKSGSPRQTPSPRSPSPNQA